MTLALGLRVNGTPQGAAWASVPAYCGQSTAALRSPSRSTCDVPNPQGTTPLDYPATEHPQPAYLVKGMMNLPRISTLNTSWQSFCIAAQAAGGDGGRLSPDGAGATAPTVPLAVTAAGRARVRREGASA